MLIVAAFAPLLVILIGYLFFIAGIECDIEIIGFIAMLLFIGCVILLYSMACFGAYTAFQMIFK